MLYGFIRYPHSNSSFGHGAYMSALCSITWKVKSIISYGLKGSCTPLIIENTSVYGMSGYKNCELKYMNEKLYRGEIEILNHKSCT